MKIYTTPTCSHCRAAKKFFQEKGVPFEEMDVATDARARVEMFGLAHSRNVPVIVIDGQVFVGFENNLSKFEESLAE
ncbi:MAG: glutaredoxin family protein [Chloroflexi bacterium]|nr:glutaredoxin family protein [Chloroflexota bacterium]